MKMFRGCCNVALNLGHTANYYYVYLSVIIYNIKGLHRRYVCSCGRVNIYNIDG
jgi:hypothetical protein